MVIEDVTGQPFAEFIHGEVAEPLGIGNLAWVWTPQLENCAPTPYGYEQKKVSYRQLACQAAGSEICPVPDFARFVAAAVPGPHGEPAGRGVLKPEMIAVINSMELKNLTALGLGFPSALSFPALTRMATSSVEQFNSFAMQLRKIKLGSMSV